MSLKKPTIVSPNKVYNSSPTIRPTSFPENEKISFNFYYLREGKEKFCYSTEDKDYMLHILNKLKCFSEYSRKQLSVDKGLCDVIRHHQIDFKSKTVSENGFGIKSVEGADDNAYQFAFSKATGRIHGFWEGSTFHIVWIDPKHDLYPWR